MRNRSLKLIASILVMTSPSLANATAWPGLPGQTEFSISYENTQYDDLLTADGAVSKGWGVASHATFFGLSYDLTDAIRLGITSGYGESSSTKPGGTTKGILDTDVHVEMNLVNPFETEGFGLGMRASYRIPGSYELQRVPHGLGKRVQAASLEVALGYSIATVIFETSLGYRLTIPRSAAAPDDIFGQSSIAWSPRKAPPCPPLHISAWAERSRLRSRRGGSGNAQRRRSYTSCITRLPTIRRPRAQPSLCESHGWTKCSRCDALGILSNYSL